MNVHVNGDRSGVGVSIVSLTGTIDVRDAADVERQLLATLAPAPRGMVVDLARATFADGAGIHALITLRSAALRAGIEPVLVALSDPVLRRLDGMGLKGVFRTAATREQAMALAALSGSRAPDPPRGGNAASSAEEPSPEWRHGSAAGMDITTIEDRPVSLLSIAGELDLRGATVLMAHIVDLAGQGSRVVVCDVSRLSVPGSDELLTVFPAAQRRSGPWPRSAVHLAAAGAG